MFNDFECENIVLVFGKTGVGKTSIINTLFNLNWKVDNAVACTTNLQSAIYSNNGKDLLIVDIPGIAESEAADEIYDVLYRNAIPRAGHLIWVFQGDVRVYRADQIAILKYQSLFRDNLLITLCLNQVDRIGFADWNKSLNTPSENQTEYISEKIIDIYVKFKKYFPQLNKEDIVPISCEKKYNISSLYNRITKP